MKKKYLLFIGMGDWFIPQIEIAKNYGFKVIVTDINKKSKSFKHSDISFNVDGRDYKKIFLLLKKSNLLRDIAYIYTGTELSKTVAYLSKKIKINWHSIKSVKICENKDYFKKHLIKNKLTFPMGISFKNLKGFKLKEKSILKFKRIIVKPSDSSSSRGVTLLKNFKDIKKAILFAKKFSSSKTIIIEEYIDGLLLDINGVIKDKNFYPLGINDKYASSKKYQVITGLKSPTSLSLSQQTKLYKEFFKTCKTLGLGPGPVKGDYIFYKNKFYILEIATRLHGPLGSIYAIPLAYDLNPFEELLKFILNKKLKKKIKRANNKFKIKITAKDNRIKNRNNLIVLEKKGIFNKNLWKSNYDIPIYTVEKKLMRKIKK
jgi:predicted ATP-grasp superfamily ATP-dependent carboligase